LRPLFARISAPTLICVTICDPYWTPADAAGCLPNGASVIITGSGHIALLFEAAPAVVDLPTAFWANPSAVVTRRRDSRHAGAACRPGWRAPLILQHENLGLIWRYQRLRVNGWGVLSAPRPAFCQA
jgi:hypothetical protein